MSTRSAQKQKQPYVVPVAKEYIAKYVHTNHPDNSPAKEVGDFSNLSRDELREYRMRYLNPAHQLAPDVSTFQGYLIQSELGSNTESVKNNEEKKQENNLYDYRTKDDLRIIAETHFEEQVQVKESEVLMDFVYKVRKDNDKFRILFDRSS